MNSEKRIPSLDGLRAVSIALVFLCHSVYFRSDDWTDPLRRIITRNGNLGVDIFFVISGYLITAFLIREWGASARINLPRFYVRRAFRIIPACYAYLGVVFLLMGAGLIPQTFRVSLLSLIFLRNYACALGSGGVEDWFTGHYWTLAVEEQFYLFWPACLAVLGPKRATWLATGLILVSPIIRAITYLTLPGLRQSVVAMTHTRMDTLMFGCLAALLVDSGLLRAAVRNGADAHLHLVAIFWVSVISPILTGRFQGVYQFLFGYTIDGLCITFIVLRLIDRPTSLDGRLLNHRAIVHLGVISYSFYLWQQMFSPLALPWSIAPTLLLAEGSYRFIEQPFFRFRDRILRDDRCRSRPQQVRTGVPRLNEYRDGIISA